MALNVTVSGLDNFHVVSKLYVAINRQFARYGGSTDVHGQYGCSGYVLQISTLLSAGRLLWSEFGILFGAQEVLSRNTSLYELGTHHYGYGLS